MINNILSYEINFFNLNLSGKKIIKHPLFSGSAIMIVGSNIANFIAYIYHVIVGRMLGPSSYGELSAVLSVLTLLFTSFNFMGVVIVKFVAAAEEKEHSGIYSWFVRKGAIMGTVLSVLLLIASPYLSSFLHIDIAIILLLPFIAILSVFGFVYRAFLQGLLRFKEVVLASNLDMGTRLVGGLILIYLGYSVFGAVVGIMMAAFLSFFLTRYYLRDYRNDGKKEIKFEKGKQVFIYTIPIFLSTIATNSIFSTDVVLVKHFFSSHDAGIYSSLSTLGKIIYFGAGPVGTVMFPMISKRHAKGQSFKKIFILSFLLTLAIAMGVVGIYWLFPNMAIGVLYGEEYLEGSGDLIWFGIFMMLITLSSLLNNFFLSRERTKVVVFVVIAAIVQVFGIWFFHSSLRQVIQVSIVAASLLLISLLIYFANDIKNGKKEQ